jgi:hypothetical protein
VNEILVHEELNITKKFPEMNKLRCGPGGVGGGLEYILLVFK